MRDRLLWLAVGCGVVAAICTAIARNPLGDLTWQ